MRYDPRAAGALCDQCVLQHCDGPVPAEHNGSNITVVASYPVSDSLRAQAPLVGPAGREISAALRSFHLGRRDVNWNYALMCMPPGLNIKKVESDLKRENKKREANGKLPLPHPVDCCKPRLIRDLARVPYVLPMGSEACKALISKDTKVMKVQGALKEVDELDEDGKITGRQRQMVPMVNPAYVLRRKSWRGAFRRSMGRALRWFRGETGWEEPGILYTPSFNQARDFLQGLRGEPIVTYDCETNSIESLVAKLRCIQFGTPDRAMVIPLLSKEDPRSIQFYTGRELTRMRKLIFWGLVLAGLPWVGHNAGFYDRIVMEQHHGAWYDSDPEFRAYVQEATGTRAATGYLALLEGVLTPKLSCDSMLLHRVCDPEMPHGLGFVGTYHTNVHDWKADKDSGWNAGSDHDLHRYGALDAVVNARVMPPMLKQLEERGQLAVLQNDHGMQNACVGLHRVGQWVWQEPDDRPDLLAYWAKKGVLKGGGKGYEVRRDGLALRVAEDGTTFWELREGARGAPDGSSRIYKWNGKRDRWDWVPMCRADWEEMQIKKAAEQVRRMALALFDAGLYEFAELTDWGRVLGGDEIQVRRQLLATRAVLEARKEEYTTAVLAADVGVDEDVAQALLDATARIKLDRKGKPKFNPRSFPQVRELLFTRWALMPPQDLLPPLDDGEAYDSWVFKGIRVGVYTDAGERATGDLILRAHLAEGGLELYQRDFIAALRLHRQAEKLIGDKLRPARRMPDVLPGPDGQPRQTWDAFGYSRVGKDSKHQAIWAGHPSATDVRWLDISNDHPSHLGSNSKYALSAVWRDGRLRTGWNAHVTTVGRLSSSSPYNMQNVKSKLRTMFVPAKGNIYVGADWDQLHLRIIANLWGIPSLLKAFREGVDPHALMAALVFPHFWEVDGHPCEANGNKWTGTAKAMRDTGKVLRYTGAYGASWKTIHGVMTKTQDPETDELVNLGMTRQEVELIYENWMNAEPEWKAMWENEVALYRYYGFLWSPMLQRRQDFNDFDIGPDGRVFGDVNKLYNYRILSFEADLANVCTREIIEAIPFDKWGPGTGLVNQCHDSVVVECPVEEADNVASIVTRIMNKKIKDHEIEYTAGADIGMNWKMVA